MRKLITIGAVLLATTLGLAACSSGSSKSSGNSGGKTAPVSLPGSVNNHGTKDVSASGASGTLGLEADDFYFSPTFVKAAGGEKITVEFKNEGKASHTFTSPTLGVDKELAPGEKASIDVTMPASGDAAFFCRFHQGSGMQGAFFTGA